MTAKESAKLIGTERTLRVNGMDFDVVIIDVKQAYGRTRYEIRPISGSGSQWVETLGPSRLSVYANVDNRPDHMRIESGN